MRWLVTLGLVLVATYATAATVYINGTAINADRVDITSGGGPTPPMPTPGPVPTPRPTAKPGACPAGARPLDQPLNFAANTWGIDWLPVPVGVTLHFCALLTRPVAMLGVRTADRTGPSQCSNVTLTVNAPVGSGIPTRTSNALNNSINLYPTALTPGCTTGAASATCHVPPGAYMIDVTGGQPRPPCTSQSVLLYWQYQSFQPTKHRKVSKHK